MYIAPMNASNERVEKEATQQKWNDSHVGCPQAKHTYGAAQKWSLRKCSPFENDTE